MSLGPPRVICVCWAVNFCSCAGLLYFNSLAGLLYFCSLAGLLYFYPCAGWIEQRVGVEPGGEGLQGKHGATINAGVPGIFHGKRTLVLSDDDGQIMEAHSISAGLDYPGVGPEHAYLKEIGRAEYDVITNDEALEAFQVLSHTEGIIPALESSHAIAHGMKLAKQMGKDEIVLINLSGRGDKDVDEVRRILAEREGKGA